MERSIIWFSGLLVVLLLIIQVSCNRNAYQYKQQEESTCCDDSVVLLGKVASVYDSVEAPQVINDSAQFAIRLMRILRRANDLQWNGGDSYCVAYTQIDTLGKISVVDYMAPPDIIDEALELFGQTLLALGDAEPAYLKVDPRKKVPYRASFVILLKKDTVSFRILGYGRILFSTAYDRPVR